MKNNKNNPDEVVTRSILREELRDVVTKKELDEVLEEKLEKFATKEYLNKRFEDFSKAMDIKFEVLSEQLERKLGDSLHAKLDRMLNHMDEVLGKYKKLDEEYDIMSHQYVRLSDRVRNHEKRLKKLESKPSKTN